ncbi:MAG: carbohydrate kinase family protein [Anaerolineales bacterium]|nr:carbohydrate kinase family protein [Anaerolineales bacterium]
MAKTYDVLVVGNYSLDLIFTGLPQMPELGKDIVASGFAMLPGEAYTSAIAMHRLGLQVGWAGDFGDDEFSRFAIQQAESEGLDTRLFVRHHRPLRRISVAASFPHERGFLTYYDPDPAIPAALKALATASARLLYVPGLYYGSLLEAGLQLARARKMKFAMDGNIGCPEQAPGGLSNPAIRKAVQSSNLFLPNASEARLLTGQDDLAQALQALGQICPLVALKDGKNGSYAWAGGQIHHAPGLRLEPLDTTGAGDCYSAGFIKAWLDDLPIEECLRWGNIAGGLSTLAPGGTGYRVNPAEVRKWLPRLPETAS